MREAKRYYANPPSQFLELLRRYPVFAPTGNPPVQIKLSPAAYVRIATVHDEVNRSYPYVRTRRRSGLRDSWTPAELGTGGDCEDLSLRKWLDLIDAGFDRSSFSLAVCHAPSGTHAVLIVHTTEGPIALDNLAWTPAALPDLLYRWQWRSLSDRSDWLEMWRGAGERESMMTHPTIRQLNAHWLRHSARRRQPLAEAS